MARVRQAGGAHNVEREGGLFLRSRHSLPKIWSLLLAIWRVLNSPCWALSTYARDIPAYVLEARSFTGWQPLPSSDARLFSATPADAQQSTLEDHPSPLSAPMFLPSLLPRAVHWRTRGNLELSEPEARSAHPLSVG